jgi:hypothetical protein
VYTIHKHTQPRAQILAIDGGLDTCCQISASAAKSI